MSVGADHVLWHDVRQTAAACGIDAVGVTDAAPFVEARRALVERKAAGLHGGMWFTYGRPERSTSPEAILCGARSIVVCARSYLPPGGRPGGGGGVIGSAGLGAVAAYVAGDAYGELRCGLEQVCRLLRQRGFDAVAVADDNRLVDRAAAARAGLGWLGRNTMLLSAELGSWTVLGSVVTAAPLPVVDAMPAYGCGDCRRCQAACPTGALDDDGVLDANRCLAWLVQAPGVFPPEHRVALGDRLYGCDDCQTVCPYNEPFPSGAPSVNENRRAGVDVLELLAMSDDELMAAFGHWYIPRRQPQYLRRNALVVLGNVGDPGSPQVSEALAGSLASASPVVAGHAVWAARRLGRCDLVEQALAGGLGLDDPDGLVAAELERSVPPRRRAESAAAGTLARRRIR